MTQTIKIMISSTRQDLDEYRDVASKVIEQLDSEKKDRVRLSVVSMEEKLQDGERNTALAVSKRWVAESDWVVLIVGWWYGTISTEAEANGKSITEFEYRYAMELMESDPTKRKVFVFVTGNKNTPEVYDAKGDEKNLLFSLTEVAEQDRPKLDKYRSLVSGPHTTFFNNIDVFREKLRLTLQKAIDTLPNEIPPEFFLKLILDLQVPIQNCISEVNELELYKTIHDQLHEVRQKVIRPLREGILPKWEEQRVLSRELERRLTRKISDLGVMLGIIKALMNNLGVESQSLFEQLKIIVNTNFLGEEEIEVPNFEDFKAKLDDFSITVQVAFSKANTLMQHEASLLQIFNEELLEKINEHRIIHHLTDKQIKQLDPELNKVAAVKKRFLEALNIHDNWQNLHNELEKIDGFEGKLFEKRLRLFCLIQAVAFTNEINAEIKRLKIEDPNNPIPSCIKQLMVYWDEINKSVSEETYKLMRENFDDTFYHVDKHTLEEVKKAGECAEEFRGLLETLRAREYKKQSLNNRSV